MRLIYTLLVEANQTSRVESILNTLRIGLNDWDRSRVLELNGVNFVNYTIICEEHQYTAIVNQLYEA